MIDRKKLRDMVLKNEPWGTITAPEGFTVAVTTDERPRFSFREWFLERTPRFAAAAAMLAVMVVSVLLFYPGGEKLVIRYSYNGETSVDLIGSFNRWDSKIAMRLDADKKEWKAEIRVPRKGIYEYQFIIDELIYSAGDSEYRITGPKGDEKAVMILSYGNGIVSKGTRNN